MERLRVFDIGFFDGGDTEYYLDLGMEVIAVEANPELAAAGRQRFSRQIDSGRLTLYHAAVVADQSLTTLKLHINHRDAGSSSTQGGWRSDESHAVEVPCITLAELMKRHGVPWYLKTDIEGMDDEVVASIPPEGAPDYLSCEAALSGRTIDTLVSFGYTDFKLINQITFTQSFEISPSEAGIRAMRKLSTILPTVGRAIRRLPDAVRPQRITWDRFRERFPYRFPSHSSGPCGEQTFGNWHSAQRTRRLLSRIDRNANRGVWFDLHARHGRLMGMEGGMAGRGSTVEMRSAGGAC